MTQCALIREALMRGDVLTHLDMEVRFGCSRGAARIRELRKAGDPIDTDMIRTPTGKHVALYSWRVPFST